MSDPHDRRQRTDFWLIMSDEDGRILTRSDGPSPAVFSGEGEAKLFLRWGMVEDGHIARTTSEDLISLLDSQCAEARSILLDPSPEMFAERMTALVRMDKERFVERLLKRGGYGLERLVVS